MGGNLKTVTLLSCLCISINVLGENCAGVCKNWRDISLSKVPQYRREVPFLDCFRRYSRLYGIPESLLVSVAAGESDFNKLAVSTSNAIGIMQIKWPITAQHLGVSERDLLFNPCLNIELGAKYLRELLTRYDNRIHHSLAAYYYGPARVPLTGKVPEAGRRYSVYIFNRYVNLFDSVINLEPVTPKEHDGTSSVLRWISNLNSERRRLNKVKQAANKSFGNYKKYYRTVHLP